MSQIQQQTRQNKEKQSMKSFDIRIGVQNLSLRVKFNCKVSISLKYRGKEYSIVEEQPLINGNFSSPSREINNLQADYNQKEDKFADNQSFTVVLYLHSSHGKLLVGSFTYKLNDIKFKKSITEKIKNSPDKNAQIKFIFELLKDRSKKELNVSMQTQEQVFPKYSSQRELRITSLRTFNSPELPVHSPRLKNESDYPPLLRSFAKGPNSTIKSNMSKIEERLASPKLLMKSNANPQALESTVDNLVTSKVQNRNSVQILKRKLSQVKQINSQGNTKYIERISQLQKELKQSKQKVSGLELELKLKESNAKYLEKDVSARKEKAELMENEIKQLNKKTTGFEQKIRELEYNLRHLTEQHAEVLHANQVLTKKNQKRQEYYRGLVDSLNQKYYEIERQKENVLYKVASLQSQIEENNKVFNNQLREKDKRSAQQKSSLSKRIVLLQKNLQQKKNQIDNLTQKCKISQKEAQQLKISIEKEQVEHSKLKNRIEELHLSVNKQEIQRKILEEEIQQLKQICNQNKALKEELQYKNEQIQMQTKKIGRMQEEIAEYEQKIKELTTNLQNMEQQYEKLYYQNISENEEVDRKKRLIAQLTEQNEQMEKNLQKINFTLRNQAIEFQEELTEMQQNFKSLKIEHDKNLYSLKQTKNELMEQIERRKNSQKQLLEFKKRIDDLQNQVQTLESRMSHQTQQFNKIKGSNVLLSSRNQNLSSQVEEFKRIKQDKEEKLLKLIEQNQVILRERDEKVQVLQENLQLLNKEIAKLQRQNQQLTHTIEFKHDEINQLRQEISFKRSQERSLNQAKLDLEKVNANHQEKIIELHEKCQTLEQQIAQLIDQNQQIDELLKQSDEESNLVPMNHEIRKRKIHDFIKNIANKDNQNEELKENIRNLYIQVDHYKNEQIHLQQTITSKNEEILKLSQIEEELKSYFIDCLTGLKDQLDQKQTEIKAISFCKIEKQRLEEERIATIDQYEHLKNEIINKIVSIHQEKNKQKQTISQFERTQIKLNSEITRYKLGEGKLSEEGEELRSTIKEINNEIDHLKDENAGLNNKITQLTLKNSQLDHTIQEQIQTIDHLNQKNHLNQKIIEQQSSQLQKQKQLIQQSQEQFNDKLKDLAKRLQNAKNELSEKVKQLSQVESQKKSKIHMLNGNIDQLKKENFDLQSIVFSQKSNTTKLKSILNELTSAISKIEKSGNIKTYYMIPVKDLLGKFEQLIQVSNKLYIDSEKKAAKRQQKAHHGAKYSHENDRFSQI